MSLQDNQNIHQSISCKLEFEGEGEGWAEDGCTMLHGTAADTSAGEIQDVSCAGLSAR